MKNAIYTTYTLDNGLKAIEINDAYITEVPAGFNIIKFNTPILLETMEHLFDNYKVNHPYIAELHMSETPNLKDLTSAFEHMNIDILNIEKLTTDQVTTMDYMFHKSDVQIINYGKFNTKHLKSAKHMYEYAKVDTIPQELFNAPLVEDLECVLKGTQFYNNDVEINIDFIDGLPNVKNLAEALYTAKNIRTLTININRDDVNLNRIIAHTSAKFLEVKNPNQISNEINFVESNYITLDFGKELDLRGITDPEEPMWAYMSMIELTLKADVIKGLNKDIFKFRFNNSLNIATVQPLALEEIKAAAEIENIKLLQQNKNVNFKFDLINKLQGL